MQNRTIDNALLALRQQGGHQGKLAEVLLEMRDVQIPQIIQFEPTKRGEMVRFCMSAIQQEPKTTRAIALLLCDVRPNLGRSDSGHRVYQCMRRLQDKGKVVKEGRFWILIDKKTA